MVDRLRYKDGAARSGEGGGLKERFGFKSIRLMILMAMLIFIITAVGSLIVIKRPEPFNELTSDILLPWMLNKGAAHISSIWWIFVLFILIALVGLNTIVCTVDRIKALIRQRQEKEGLSKRILYPLFPHIVHIGFVIALIGHLISSIYGFKTWNNMLVEGEMTAIPFKEDRYIHLDDIKEDYGADGGLISVKAVVSVFDKMNNPLKEGIIDINRPFFYKGVVFYHSHHGKTMTGLKLKVDGEVYAVKFGDGFRLSDGRVIKLGRLFSDFAVDAKGRPYNRSDNPANPVQELILTEDNNISKGWLPLQSIGYESKVGDLKVKLVDYSVNSYLVMAINKDPGAKVVLIGSSVFMAGFILLLLLREERRELVRC